MITEINKLAFETENELLMKANKAQNYDASRCH